MATAGELHPTAGARLILELDRAEDDQLRAHYNGFVYTPTETFRFTVKLEQGGKAEIEAIDDGNTLNADDRKRFDNLAKSTARAAKRKAGEQLPPWPSRIMRWRGPGRG